MSNKRVSDARDYVHESVRGGRCANDPEVLKAINSAVKMLMDEGDWKGLVKAMRVCAYNGYVHLPRGVEAVLKVDICGKPKDVWHNAYEFIEAGPGDIDMIQRSGSPDYGIMDMGLHPTFWPFLIEGMKVAAFSTEATDIGKNLDIYGTTDPYYNDVRMNAGVSGGGEAVSIRQWQGGVEGEIDHTDMTDNGLSATTFAEITSVRKPVTDGYVTLFGHNPTTNAIQYLAKYHPFEQDPHFRWYRIPSSLTSLAIAGATPQNNGLTLKMLVKLGYTELVYDDEVLPIQDLQALEMAIKSIEEKKRGNFQLGLAYQADAIRLLSKELMNHKREQRPIDIRIEGGYSFGRDYNEV